MSKNAITASKKIVRLDVMCGNNKQPGFLGMDRKSSPSVDIVHDPEVFPWPIEDNSVSMILMTHTMERIDPRKMVEMFDECWRILKPEGQLLITTHYAGSWGGYQDPQHFTPGFNPSTFEYFDPRYQLYETYEPRPWWIAQCHYEIGGVINVVMEAMKKNTGEPKPIPVKGKRKYEPGCNGAINPWVESGAKANIAM